MKTLIASLLVVVGCASPAPRLYDDPASVAVLTVDNQRGEDEVIYVMHAGIRGRRLGQVTSYGSASFVLFKSDVPLASDVQFLARALVTGTTDLSDAITAERGAAYEWRLTPARGHSYLAFRYPRR